MAAVSKHLTSIHDFLAFRGVCSSWRSAATFDNFDGEVPRVPWLMCVSSEGEEMAKEGNTDGGAKKVVVSLFDLSTEKARILNNVSPMDGKGYLSSRGWILCVSECDGSVYLTHPVWRIKIELPGLGTLPGYTLKEGIGYIKKMVLSGSPTRKTDLVVMVIWGKLKRLGFSRPGDLSWTVMGTWRDSFCDILYHNRRLYAVNLSKSIVECDIHGPNPTHLLQPKNSSQQKNKGKGGETLITVSGDVAYCSNHVPQNDPLFMAQHAGDNNDFDNNFPRKLMLYLVKSFGKFLIVSRCIVNNRTFRFQILEVDLKDGSHKNIKRLWKTAIFLGLNSSVCLELPEWGVVKPNYFLGLLPEWGVVKPNYIYFTDDHSGKGKGLDMGVWQLMGGVPMGLHHGCSGAFLAPPVWVVPSI
ncbi:Putative F-box protein [Striga hermonthica]|uniref:F-box protein n=1 Tax=Striga hermonthica TaxID=68872 RepID=A0A9N7RBL5_STRHE|nr:Putative F-box protein [Striga hermonthica]